MGPPEYEAGVLTARPGSSVIISSHSGNLLGRY
jgi:hypothetical protein